MKEIQTTTSISDHLLANRELIDLDNASHYLVARARVRTPLGAEEFLGSSYTHGRSAYDKRVRICIDTTNLYRQLFPDEFARSASTDFSTQKEHEFYRLVHRKLFPLHLSEEVDLLTHLDREPQFFLPFIPMKGIQKHIWAEGMFNFWEIETAFKLAQVLSERTGAGGKGWQALYLGMGLEPEPFPGPPLGAFGWTHFTYSCAVDESPLRYFPLAFNMICYQTGNPWLDLPQIGYVGFEWSIEEMTKLLLAREQSNEMVEGVELLSNWLDEDPVRRIARAIGIWNKASALEHETGYAGMLVDPETGELR